MKMKIYSILISAFLCQNFIKGQSKVIMSMEYIEVELLNNPYLNRFDTEILGPNRDILSANLSFTKTPPSDLMFELSINFNGADIPPMETGLCAMFEDKLYAPEVLDHGVPQDKFPRECPIPPFDGYQLVKYHFSTEGYPALPDGFVISKILAYEPSNKDEPIMRLTVKSEVKNEGPIGSISG